MLSFLGSCAGQMDSLMYPKPLIDETKKLCDSIQPETSYAHMNCLYKSRKLIMSDCKKPETSVKFCQKYGLTAHLNAPYSSINDDGYKITKPIPKDKIKKIEHICYDNLGVRDGDLYSKCVIRYTAIYDTECQIPLEQLKSKYKSVCEELKD